ncbi:DUF2255 family protein [Pseudofrankia inefficax]|uniref:Uncharacterized conserved protein UCP028498 n=1 Tax=Pseudofrankia inefficax (strain DSM 45817 / CECT 9037 / DDB 130130 / EuI1c) TaxID=298654 RepID=E3J2I8_PSEI1|nr:DUF2255 family protein [Pseudofrankia inefficax]ADP80502.1 Uncharacterized conserved protein UCP028498 [Pseudofrankia inefficax]
MTTWTPSELDALGSTEEMTITTRRADGSLRPAVPIWVVRVEDDLYVRSYRGRDGSWFQRAAAQGTAHVQAAGVDRDVTVAGPGPASREPVDRAYRAKYARYGDSYLRPMVADPAVDTTLRLTPTD